MNVTFGALALLIASPAAAQTAPADPHAGHAQHQPAQDRSRHHQQQQGEDHAKHMDCCKEGQHCPCCKGMDHAKAEGQESSHD